MTAGISCCLLLGFAFGGSCLRADSAVKRCRQKKHIQMQQLYKYRGQPAFYQVSPVNAPEAGSFTAILKGFLQRTVQVMMSLQSLTLQQERSARRREINCMLPHLNSSPWRNNDIREATGDLRSQASTQHYGVSAHIAKLCACSDRIVKPRGLGASMCSRLPYTSTMFGCRSGPRRQNLKLA